MSIDFNLVIFGGRLTDDVKELSSKGCKFDVASNRSYRDKEGKRKEVTTYMSITCWGQLAELVMKNCRKGDAVLVQGKLEVRKITDKEGNIRKFTNIVASDVRFMSMRSEGERDDSDVTLPGLPDMDPKTAKILKNILNSRG